MDLSGVACIFPRFTTQNSYYVQSPKRFRASISGGTPTPNKFYPCEPGGEVEEPNAEGGPEGEDKKSGLLGGGSSPLE